MILQKIITTLEEESFIADRRITETIFLSQQ